MPKMSSKCQKKKSKELSKFFIFSFYFNSEEVITIVSLLTGDSPIGKKYALKNSPGPTMYNFHNSTDIFGQIL